MFDAFIGTFHRSISKAKLNEEEKIKNVIAIPILDSSLKKSKSEPILSSLLKEKNKIVVAKIISFDTLKLEEYIKDKYYTKSKVVSPSHYDITSDPNDVISVGKYFERIMNYSRYMPFNVSVIMSIIYIERFVKQSPIGLGIKNIHKIIAVTIFLSSKFMYDIESLSYFKYFAKVFGVEIKVLHKIELEFLKDLDYKLYIGREDYDRVRDDLIKNRIVSESLIPKYIP